MLDCDTGGLNLEICTFNLQVVHFCFYFVPFYRIAIGRGNFRKETHFGTLLLLDQPEQRKGAEDFQPKQPSIFA